MHRFVRIFTIASLLVAALIIQQPSAAQPTLRVTHVVNGTLGDRSFFDSAQEGLERAVTDFGIELKVIELGEDQARWEPGIDDAMADTDSYDVLVLGGSLVADYVMARADLYPDKKFIFHDEPIDFTRCKCANVYNVIYAQNEGAYLAGVYAAAMMKENALPNLSRRNIIGAVGGLDIPVINDFIVGYAQGAKSVIPEMTVLVQYIGGERPFFNVAKGLEIALAMYDQGADFTFSVAGGSGLGMIQAAQQRGKYFIGVDSDQWLLLKDSDPAAAEVILTSMIKNVGGALYRAIDLMLKDELPFGETEIVGIAEGAIGLAKNEYYERITPDSVKAIVAQAEEDVTKCRVIVETTLAPRPCEPAE
ncbi:MAG: BMP family ABC transporter substrate-binding protein [Candidatus Thermofonsia Clade 1 bacterium]|jgi:basic membrane protein A|uniref:BMP family ABC transporter substrate-binding protein n=1 Tax=Candidatus Thermofonsia Clade 1 bacterium TaxID=2364210 RepID=A0A2M8P0T5_9CHLR|nr:MAG: BMP family ABC transporter substrate-binding protein [Candidatus Thermofonsia Clade 1 bacterium]